MSRNPIGRLIFRFLPASLGGGTTTLYLNAGPPAGHLIRRAFVTLIDRPAAPARSAAAMIPVFLRDAIRRRVHSFGHRLLLRLSERRTIAGVLVLVTEPRQDFDTEHLFAKVAGALALVERYKPMRLRRLQKDVERIWVRRHPACRAAFFHASRSCVLDSYFVDTFPVEAIGSSIVHEGVHARVRAAGVRTHAPAKEERLCRRAELRYGLAIPGGESVVARARASLELADDEIAPRVDWAEERRQRRRMQIEDSGFPRWMKRWLERRL